MTDTQRAVDDEHAAEVAFVSALLHRPELTKQAEEIASPADLADPFLSEVFGAALERGEGDWKLDELVGDIAAAPFGWSLREVSDRVVSILDAATPSTDPLVWAKRVRHESLWRQAKVLASRLAADPMDVEAREDLDGVTEALRRSDDGLSARPQRRPWVAQGKRTWGDLSAVKEPPVLVKGLLQRQRTTLLGGVSGGGKTMLGLHIAGCLASGWEPWAVTVPCEPRRVLYLGFDTQTRLTDIARRLHQQFPDMSWADRFFGWGSGSDTIRFNRSEFLMDDEGAMALLEAIDSSGINPDLIICDTVATSMPPGADENATAAATDVIARWNDIAITLNTSVLALHHPTKAAATEGSAKFAYRNPSAYIRGAYSFEATASVTAGLFAPDDHPHLRRLGSRSNHQARYHQWFKVCDGDEGELGRVNYWVPVSDPVGYDSQSST